MPEVALLTRRHVLEVVSREDRFIHFDPAPAAMLDVALTLADVDLAIHDKLAGGIIDQLPLQNLAWIQGRSNVNQLP